MTITVNDIAPSVLLYLLNPAVYTKGTAISTNTATSGGGVAITYSVTPVLPAGLAFDTDTGAISGTPTVISASTNYTVTGVNTGGTTTIGVTITVNDIALSAKSYSLISSLSIVIVVVVIAVLNLLLCYYIVKHCRKENKGIPPLPPLGIQASDALQIIELGVVKDGNYTLNPLYYDNDTLDPLYDSFSSDYLDISSVPPSLPPF